MPLRIVNRSCGDCSACCVTLDVAELQKPAHQPCKFLRKGCSIYDARPQVCRAFDCAWLHGLYGLTGAQRPDRLGLIVWASDATIQVAETRPGASKEKAGRTVLYALARRNVHVRVHEMEPK